MKHLSGEAGTPVPALLSVTSQLCSACFCLCSHSGAMGDWGSGTECWGLTSALCPARQGVDSYSSLLKWRGRGAVYSHLAILAGSELSLGILLLPASFVMVTAQLQAKLASQMPCVVDADSCPLSCPSYTCRPLLLVPFYRWAVVGLKLLGDREKYIGVQDRTRKNNWSFLSRISRARLVLHWEGCACWYFPKVVGGAHN